MNSQRKDKPLWLKSITVMLIAVLCFLAILCGNAKSAMADETTTEDETVPVYCLYNRITSEHLFTRDVLEYNDWAEKYYTKKDYWEPEGIAWYANYDGMTNFVYRLYNPALGAQGKTSHYYTNDHDEIDNLRNNYGWEVEDTSKGFCAGGNVAVYTCYNENLGSAHHYTTDKTEWSGLSKHQWALEKSKNGSNGVFQVAKAGTKCSSTTDKTSNTGKSILHTWSSTKTNGKYVCSTCGVKSSINYLACTSHKWVAQYKTEQVAKYRSEEYNVCNWCRQEIPNYSGGAAEHAKAHALAGEYTGGHHTEVRQILDHYETEQVLDHYECSKCHIKGNWNENATKIVPLTD